MHFICNKIIVLPSLADGFGTTWRWLRASLHLDVARMGEKGRVQFRTGRVK